MLHIFQNMKPKAEQDDSFIGAAAQKPTKNLQMEQF
jgi:hypothetical protein